MDGLRTSAHHAHRTSDVQHLQCHEDDLAGLVHIGTNHAASSEHAQVYPIIARPKPV